MVEKNSKASGIPLASNSYIQFINSFYYSVEGFTSQTNNRNIFNSTHIKILKVINDYFLYVNSTQKSSLRAI